jgi:hypothetical protein
MRGAEMKWEYRMERLSLARFSKSDALKTLDFLGQDGWELVAVSPTQEDPAGAPENVLIFKRPR